MAKNITTHVRDMTDDEIPDGTAVYLQVRSPSGAIAEHAQWVTEHAQWVTSGSDPETKPKEPPYAEAVDLNNTTLPERLFMQNRFMVTYSDREGLVPEPATWAQLNDTNFPTMDIPALRQALKNGYDAQRTYEDQDPS